MKRFREVYGSKYLGWQDIGKVGESAVLTVTGADYRMLRNPATGEEREKLVLDSAEFDKPFVMNITNGDYIIAALGSDLPSDWIGSKLRVVVEMVSMGTQKVEGLRVRGVKAPAKAQAAGPQRAAEPPARGDGDPGPSDEDFHGITSDDIPVNF